MILFGKPRKTCKKWSKLAALGCLRNGSTSAFSASSCCQAIFPLWTGLCRHLPSRWSPLVALLIGSVPFGINFHLKAHAVLRNGNWEMRLLNLSNKFILFDTLPSQLLVSLQFSPNHLVCQLTDYMLKSSSQYSFGILQVIIIKRSEINYRSRIM